MGILNRLKRVREAEKRKKREGDPEVDLSELDDDILLDDGDMEARLALARERQRKKEQAEE